MCGPATRTCRNCAALTCRFDFDSEYQRALVDGASGIAVRFVAIPALIQMKREAGRSQDLKDMEMLSLLANMQQG